MFTKITYKYIQFKFINNARKKQNKQIFYSLNNNF